jgi:hypothetical protein
MSRTGRVWCGERRLFPLPNIPLVVTQFYRVGSEQRIGNLKMVRAADAKEVGMGNPAEETYCPPKPILELSETSTPRKPEIRKF